MSAVQIGTEPSTISWMLPLWSRSFDRHGASPRSLSLRKSFSVMYLMRHCLVSSMAVSTQSGRTSLISTVILVMAQFLVCEMCFEYRPSAISIPATLK